MKHLLLIVSAVISFNYAHAAASSSHNQNINFISDAANHDTQTALAVSQMIQIIPGNTAPVYQIGFKSISTMQVLGCLIISKDTDTHIPDGIAEVIAEHASLLHRMRRHIKAFFDRTTKKRISCVDDFLMARDVIFKSTTYPNHDFAFFDASRSGVSTYFYTNNKSSWIGGKRMHEVQADRQCYIFKNDRVCHLLQKPGAAPIDQKRDALLQAKNFALAVSVDGATVAQYFLEKATYIPPSLSRKHTLTSSPAGDAQKKDTEKNSVPKKQRRG